jgi:tetratricopeptide (TPR) repeat protein
MPKIRVTGVSVGSPLLSASMSWEYPSGDGTGGRGGGGCLLLSGRRTPKVRAVRDPVVLGVHPASTVDVGVRGPAGQILQERVPVYVPRDADGELESRVADSVFVLLVGDSSAGKSRAAYQALAGLPDHVLIVPRDRASLPSAIGRAAATRRCVLWLDDLEGYLGAGVLTRADVVALVSERRAHRVVMATLRAAEEAVLSAEDARTPGRREIHEVLDLACRIPISRTFSPSEQSRATALAWDPRISEALEHMDHYGIPEYLAAGPELMHAWEDAWSANTDRGAPGHPRGAALIAAAVDVRRSGYVSPLPRALLEQVHESYLEQRGGSRLRPEALAEAWAWATSPRRATTALLEPLGDRQVQVFDYLLDRVQRQSRPSDHVPAAVIEAALTVSSPADADSIGELAYEHGRYDLAEKAFHVSYQARAETLGAEHLDTLTARADHAYMLRDLDRPAEAEAEQRAIAEIAACTYGPEHPRVLESRAAVGFALLRQEQSEKAEAELRSVQDLSSRVLGPDHEITLSSRHIRAMALHRLNRLDEAEAENRFLLELRTRQYGSDDWETLRSRGNRAGVLYSAGRLDEAERETRAVSESWTRVVGLAHPHTLQFRALHADVLRALGRHAESGGEHREVADIAMSAHGPAHSRVLSSRVGAAFSLIQANLPDQAEPALRAVLDSAFDALGPGDEVTLAARHAYAIALRELGRHDDEKAQNKLALAAWIPEPDARRRWSHYDRENLADFIFYAGQLSAAENQAREILETRTGTLGPEHYSTIRARLRLISILNAAQRHHNK